MALEGASLEHGDPYVVHQFDTDSRDLQRCGYVVELREHPGSLQVVASRFGSDEGPDTTQRAQAQIDSSWAIEILSGVMSPLAALERRLRTSKPKLVDQTDRAAALATLQLAPRHVGTARATRVLSDSRRHTAVPQS